MVYLQPAAGDNVILKARVPDELLMHLRGVLDFIEVIAPFRFAKNVDRAVIVVIAESRFADDGRAFGQVLLGPGNHRLLVRDLPAGQINSHLLIGAEHGHGPVSKVVPGIQPCLNLRRNDPKAGLMLIQPEHFAALHAAHEIGFGDGHGSKPPPADGVR